MKIVFLFGAGASYGSGSVVPREPPLGADLFDRLIQADGSKMWRTYERVLKKSEYYQNRGDFEKFFDDFARNENVITVQQLHNGIADYFTQFECAPNIEENNYYKLISNIRDNDLLKVSSFSSLNYDCILEDVMIKMKISYKDVLEKSSFDNEGLNLFKIHGSCNYVFSSKNWNVQGASFSPNINLEISVMAVGREEAFEFYSKSYASGLWRVMSLYNSLKEFKSSRKTMEKIQVFWQNEIEEATHIVVIGTRFMPHDEHIWAPIYESDAKLIFYGDDGPSFKKENMKIIENEYFDSSCASFINHL